MGVAAVEMVLALLEIAGRQSTTGGYAQNSEENRTDSRSGIKAHAIIYCTFQISIALSRLEKLGSAGKERHQREHKFYVIGMCDRNTIR